MGAISLAQYAEDAPTANRVTRAVQDIQRVLDADAGTGNATAAGELQAADKALAEGRTWDGLANLRRAIEAELRDLASQHRIPMERRGAGQILRALVQRGAVETDVAEQLSHVLRTANRGVHGEPVDPSEATESLLVARDVLERLRA